MSAVFVCLPEERDRWLATRRVGISASEIATVLGISPWDSSFNLYWAKTLGWDGDETELMRTGSHLENAIADWWADNHDPHENLDIRGTGLYASSERPWQLATPDRRLCHADKDVALLECKWVSYSWDGWGEPGTDEIPAHYRAQVQQQMDVMEVDQTYIAALGPGGFRHYEVARDEHDIALQRKAGEAFMAMLANGDPPDLDAHDATLAAVKRLHPDLEDVEVEVDSVIAYGYRMACADVKEAEERKQLFEVALRQQMGSARRATFDGERIATRVISEVAESTRTVAAHRRDYLLAPREPKS